MTHEITASWDTLLDQSMQTGEDYYWRASRVLAKQDEKYTQADVIALAQIMAYDFRTTSIGVAAQKISDGLASVEFSIDALTDCLKEKDQNQ
jgi:hypothetical protein